MKRFEKDEFLVFQLDVGKYSLGDAFAIVGEAGVQMDFLNYIDLVEFYINQTEQPTRYEGWFSVEENTFVLDISNPELPFVEIKGETIKVDPEQIAIIDDDLFVDLSLISDWFSIRHEIFANQLVVELSPSRKLPFQERMAREQRSSADLSKNESTRPELARTYGIFSPQKFDFRLNTAYREINSDVSTTYSVIGARDIALLHTDFFFAGSDVDYLSNARLTLSKESLDADLLGPLKATSYKFGDIQPVRVGRTGARSVGVSVSNASVTNELDTEFTNITGLLQTGWDAELYRNGILLEQVFDVESGEYSFLDVPLLLGLNEFEIVKYGPQGQVQKEYKEILVDKNLIEKDRLTYAVSLTANDRSLFNAQKRLPDDIQEKGYTFASDFRTNLLGTAVNFGVVSEFGTDNDLTRANLGFSKSITNASFLSVGGGFTSKDAYGVNVGYRGIWNKQRYSLGYGTSSFKDADNDQRRYSHSASGSLAGYLPLTDRSNLSHNNRIRLFSSGENEEIELTNQLGFNVNRWGIFNSLRLIEQTIDGETERQYDGSVSTQLSSYPYFFRLSSSYDFADGIEFNSVNADLNYSINDDFTYRLSSNYSFENDSYTINNALGYTHKNFLLFGQLDYSTILGWSVGLNLSLGMTGPSDYLNPSHVSNRGQTQTGSLSVRVFHDENLNAEYDPGEMLLPDVEIKSLQALKSALTDASGIAVIDGIPNFRKSDIEIQQETLPDPMFKPLVPGVSIRFRKGYADSLDYPVALTSELEGTVLLDKNGVLLEGRRVPIQLVNSKGKLIDETESEFDGYYVFYGIFSGDYFIKIDDEYLTKERIDPIALMPVSIRAKDEDYVVKDIQLRKKVNKSAFMTVLKRFDNQRQKKLFTKLKQDVITEFAGDLRFYSDGSGSSLLASGFYHTGELANQECDRVLTMGYPCEVVESVVWK